MKEEMGKEVKILTQAKVGLWGSYRGRRGYVHICPFDSITTLKVHEQSEWNVSVCTKLLSLPYPCLMSLRTFNSLEVKLIVDILEQQ